jgi:hypothetical protein
LVEIVLDFLVIHEAGKGVLVHTVDEKDLGDLERLVVPVL